MSIQFNADEIFEMAEQIERNGAKFYRKAAEGFEDSGTRDTLLNLASWEDQHLKIFSDMRASLPDKDRGWEMFDPEGQAALYLRAMADGHVFDPKADPSEKLTGKETLEEIYRTAMGLEKDSIVFYQGIREMVPERLGKDKIDDVIKEEMRHVTILSNQLTSLKP
jgi:rubrerythrin